MKVKVIDLKKLMDSGEIPPKKIKYKNEIYNRTKVILDTGKYWWTYINKDKMYSLFNISELNNEVEIIEDTPTFKELFQQEINNENEILLSRLESDTKLDIIKKYITSEETIDNFKTIESRNEWLEVHDKILDIIDNFKLQNESGEIIEETPKVQVEMTQEEYNEYLDRKLNMSKENKKIEKIGRKARNITNQYLKEKINKIIDKINGE